MGGPATGPPSPRCGSPDSTWVESWRPATAVRLSSNVSGPPVPSERALGDRSDGDRGRPPVVQAAASLSRSGPWAPPDGSPTVPWEGEHVSHSVGTSGRGIVMHWLGAQTVCVQSGAEYRDWAGMLSSQVDTAGIVRDPPRAETRKMLRAPEGAQRGHIGGFPPGARTAAAGVPA